MKLYHGSLEIVQKPEIRKANRTLDYGSGFYTTTSYEQAEAWVRRRTDEAKQNIGYVNVYDIPEALPTSLRLLIFQSPTEDWVDFVMRNRTEKGFVHDYDIVYGPVANDRVYAAFALYEGGLLNKQDLIKELKTYKLVDQYLFHTEAALLTLTFIEAKEVMQ
ncbi:MAG: DUF3990 domain-containing protein [Bacteroidales bacterium]|nr:DUF3990 domain-containing protein [Bacteroidales bacterium]